MKSAVVCFHAVGAKIANPSLSPHLLNMRWTSSTPHPFPPCDQSWIHCLRTPHNDCFGGYGGAQQPNNRLPPPLLSLPKNHFPCPGSYTLCACPSLPLCLLLHPPFLLLAAALLVSVDIISSSLSLPTLPTSCLSHGIHFI